jgi:hypothetical protein
MMPFRLANSYRPSSCTTQTLKKEAASLSEIIYQFTWPHISEDLNVLQQRRSNHIYFRPCVCQKTFHWR